MQNLLDNLKNLLQKDKRLVSEGEFFKNKVIELALKLDKDLIKLLLSDEKMKEVFFIEVDKILIFDKDKFIKFVSNKQFLPDSYTAFKNKIGLIDGDGELSPKRNIKAFSTDKLDDLSPSCYILAVYLLLMTLS